MIKRTLKQRERPDKTRKEWAADTFEREQLRGAAAKSNEVLHQLGPDIQC